MTDYLAAARAVADEMCAVRREIHRHPELGNREFRTAAFIEDHLRRLGIETRRVTETAVVGTLTGGRPGRCAALRADMDALPLTEATGCAFASENPGVMHACGHDVHMAAVLGAARLLAGRRDTLPGSVIFLFQPDEEGYGGAERMIRAGCLDGVDAVFGAHVSSTIAAGRAGVRFGKFYAAANLFDVTVKGRSAHGAERENGVDALAAAAEMIPALIALPDSFPGERCVVTVGTITAGEPRVTELRPTVAQQRQPAPAGCQILSDSGLGAGVIVGKVTEFYTSHSLPHYLESLQKLLCYHQKFRP